MCVPLLDVVSILFLLAAVASYLALAGRNLQKAERLAAEQLERANWQELLGQHLLMRKEVQVTLLLGWVVA